MNILSLIGTGAAFANYRKAKAQFDALKEQQDGLAAAVQTYNYNKYNDYAENVQVDTKPFDAMDGVQVSTILRVGNLVGKYKFHAKPSVVLSNTSDSSYFIQSVSARTSIFGLAVTVYTGSALNPTTQPQSVSVNKTLNPNETMEVELPGGYAVFDTDDLAKLRQLICEAAGKRLITSCPKLSITGSAEKANVDIFWKTSESSSDTKEYWRNDLSGVLRYCGEAYYAK